MKFLHLAGAAMALAMAAPAAEAATMNRAGYWAMGVEDAASCTAVMSLAGGRQLVLVASKGEIGFGVRGTALPTAKGGVLATEAYSFGFTPTTSKDGALLYAADHLNPREVAALRLARKVTLTLDGKPLAEAATEGTGLDVLVDEIVQCSQGQAGWWGEGVKTAANVSDDGYPLNPEGFWALAAKADLCVAFGDGPDDTRILFFATDGSIGFSVYTQAAAKRGRRGVLEMDGYSVPFKPDYDEDDPYFTTSEFLDKEAVFLLTRTSGFAVKVDKREQMSLDVTDSGFSQVLLDLIACSKGESGWWGEGAKAS